MTDKKQRGKNFTTEEELLLVDLVISQKHILENKKSDAVNWKIKNEAWMKLEECFKSQSGIHRPWKTLRDKYDNMKRKSKMELATEKRETYRTGGGIPANASVSAVSEKILSLVGNSATGLYNPFNNDTNNNINDEQMEEEFLDNMETVNNSSILEDDFPDELEVSTMSECKELPEIKTKPTIEPSSSGVKFNASAVKRKMEEEKVKLLKLQQVFYEGENRRANEKHKLEIESMKLKTEILAKKRKICFIYVKKY
ncbi:uncharacterized protein LOC119610154 [Lucilia sericata]|uniref:uncharacterized protein LOC119610154 n=1 Tax=Lucilia sericata TaxID=13632 RepID=UPI0018A83E54|nr:uncharacterized protein LOC119610154 [Lucilia sericata]